MQPNEFIEQHVYPALASVQSGDLALPPSQLMELILDRCDVLFDSESPAQDEIHQEELDEEMIQGLAGVVAYCLLALAALKQDSTDLLFSAAAYGDSLPSWCVRHRPTAEALQDWPYADEVEITEDEILLMVSVDGIATAAENVDAFVDFMGDGDNHPLMPNDLRAGAAAVIATAAYACWVAVHTSKVM